MTPRPVSKDVGLFIDYLKGLKMETKYTSDGRKVVIIGQLNQVEYIVQEIFVTAGGDEIPSGEKFTTKSLHDQPLETYKDRQAKTLALSIEKQEAEAKKLRQQIEALEGERKARAKLLKATDSMLKSIGGFDFDLFCDVMAGNFKYVVVDESYYFPVPKSFEKAVIDTSDSYFDIKLISLFGASDGDFEYKINAYKDGSGSWSKIKFIRDDAELNLFFEDWYKGKLNDGGLSIDDLIQLKKHGIELPKDVLEEVKAKHRDQINKHANERIAREQEYIRSNNERLDSI